MLKNRIVFIYLVGTALWAASIALALYFGSVAGADARLIFELRLPRVLLASAVGFGLSVSGAVLQAIFANALCEPYTLGVSSGAALGAVIAQSLGISLTLGGLVGPSLLGAMGVTALLTWASSQPGIRSSTLLLIGIMMSFLGSSAVALWISISERAGLASALGWLFGNLSQARLAGALPTLVGVLLLFLSLWKKSSVLDRLLLGEESAHGLGIDLRAARNQLIWITSTCIALCVSSAGAIGFIGLLIPHWSRRLVGSLHRHLLPIAGICGATALTLADLLARTVARPYELPVGTLTAILGAPFFILVLIRRPEPQ